MDLAIEIWKRHIKVFEQFDLVCNNGHSLEDETKSNALFNAMITLSYMRNTETRPNKREEIGRALQYLRGSKYYSEVNQDSDY